MEVSVIRLLIILLLALGLLCPLAIAQSPGYGTSGSSSTYPSQHTTMTHHGSYDWLSPGHYNNWYPSYYHNWYPFNRYYYSYNYYPYYYYYPYMYTNYYWYW